MDDSEWEPDSSGDEEEALFEVIPQSPLPEQGMYVSSIDDHSGLHLSQEGKIRHAFDEHSEAGLFGLFFTQKFKDTLHGWTNAVLKRKGEEEVSPVEMDAMIGLEMAMSIVHLDAIKD